MEPFLVPITDEQQTWYAEDLAAKIAVTRDLAGRFDAVHIPLQDIFTAQAAGNGPDSVIDDGVHPSARGHELIAQTWWRTANGSGSASSTGRLR